ncbi:MAG: hypothetical protein ACRDP3_04005 [Streptomyces sp.]|uniref:hypothetical protein n=1 Tax=Streptomyces sp. TaxID=1931 RepID=UPI003D6C122F
MKEIEKASRDAVEAARQGDQFSLMLAAIQAAQQQPVRTVQAPAPVVKSSGGAAKWAGIGVAATFLSVAIAVSLVSAAIATVCLTVCVLILRDVWNSIRKGS